MHHIRRVRGFTLLELLAVITIIGILATLAVVGITNATRRGRDARRNSDLVNVKQALELYAQDNATYPVSASSIAFSNASPGVLNVLKTGGYMNTIPTDPKNSGSNVYRYISDAGGTNYSLAVVLEDTKTKESLTSPTDCTVNQTNVATKGNGVVGTGSPQTQACLRLTND